MRLSVVIPTFNRGDRILTTVEGVLGNRVRNAAAVEVVVVDDGSKVPASTWLSHLRPNPPFSLQLLRQSNAGPACARNRGYAASTGELVLFLDDDILPAPDLLDAHVSAHASKPGAVICGRCPWKVPSSSGAVFRLLGRLGYDPAAERDEEFLPINVVASGQISVERKTFALDKTVYRGDLVTPAAEEYELSARLKDRGIPVFLASRIVAVHDSPVSLLALCAQQYKHGVGCGEAARRSPESLNLRELAAILTASHLRSSNRGLSQLPRLLKLPLTTRGPREALLALARALDAAAPQWDALSALYRLVIGLHFTAGVREGWKHFAPCPDRHAT